MSKMIDGEKLIEKFEKMKKMAREVEASENFDELKVLISRSSIGAWDWAIKAVKEIIDEDAPTCGLDCCEIGGDT